MIQTSPFGRQGQATMESLVILPALILTFGLFGFQIFELVGRTMIHHLLEKALLCEASDQKKNCEQEFRQQVSLFSKNLKIQKYLYTKLSSYNQSFGLEMTKKQILKERHSIEVVVAFPLKRTLHILKELPWSNFGPPIKNQSPGSSQYGS